MIENGGERLVKILLTPHLLYATPLNSLRLRQERLEIDYHISTLKSGLFNFEQFSLCDGEFFISDTYSYWRERSLAYHLKISQERGC